MSRVKQEYIKNKEGDIISPITSIESVKNSEGVTPPQIVAWCYAVWSGDSVNIKAGYNISRITKVINGVRISWKVEFTKPLKDKFYASNVSIDCNDYASETISIYNHNEGWFQFDTFQNTNQLNPMEANIIVVR